MPGAAERLAAAGYIAGWKVVGALPARLTRRAADIGADLVSDESALGRPRTAPGVGERLGMLADLVTGGSKAPAPVLAAVVHGELLSLAPFGSADGVVARAASRWLS